MHIKNFRDDGELDWQLLVDVGRKSVLCTCVFAICLRWIQNKNVDNTHVEHTRITTVYGKRIGIQHERETHVTLFYLSEY